MAKRPKTAGDDIEARCTRCREVTNHTVVALVEGRVVRVQCNICDGTHNYYPPAPEPKVAVRPALPKAPTEKAPRATARNVQAAEREEWEAAARSAAAGNVTIYAMDRAFRSGELIRHPLFGLGVVKTLVPPGKAVILFEVGAKLLRCG